MNYRLGATGALVPVRALKRSLPSVVAADKEWADTLSDDAESIIRACAGKIIEIRVGTDDEDQLLGRDYIVSCGEFACRLRRPVKWAWRGIDVAIRSSRPLSGNPTDEQKMKRGLVRWALFGWVTPGAIERIGEWYIVDVPRLVESSLLDRAPLLPDPQGRGDFKVIRVDDLTRAQAIVDCVRAPR